MNIHHPEFENYIFDLKNFSHNREPLSFDRNLEHEIGYMYDKIKYIDKSYANECERNHYNQIISFLKHITKSFIKMQKMNHIKVNDTDSDLQILQYFVKNDNLNVYLFHPEFDLDKYVFHRHKRNIYNNELEFSNEFINTYECMFWTIISVIRREMIKRKALLF